MQKQTVNSQDIEIRDFARSDVDPLIEYWLSNSEDYWLRRGISKNKFKTRDEYKASFNISFEEHGDIKSLATIEYKKLPIGVHTLTDLIEGEHGVFHADIWDEDRRGHGIGFYSYIKAIDFFMNKLRLKKIVFKTPKDNVPSIRIKDKLGIPCLGEVIYRSPLLLNPQEAFLYEIDSSSREALLRFLEIEEV